MRIDKVSITPEYFGRKLPKQDVTVLKQDSGLVWMSDCPQERVFMGSAARLVKPGMTVLTAGLGLGVFPRMALDRGAAQIDIVEQDIDVIKAVGPKFENDLRVSSIRLGDVGDHMKAIYDSGVGLPLYDLAYIDIWGGTPVDLQLLDRYRLKNLASKVAKHVTIWALDRQERTMRNEIKQTIESVNSPDVVAKGHSHYDLALRMSHAGFFLPSLFLADPESRFGMSSIRFFKYIRSQPEAAREQAIALFKAANEAALDEWKNEMLEKMLANYVETGDMNLHAMDAVAALFHKDKLPDLSQLEEDSNGH